MSSNGGLFQLVNLKELCRGAHELKGLAQPAKFRSIKLKLEARFELAKSAS